SKHAVDEYTAILDADTSQVLSISYGACESYVNATWPGLIASEHELFEQAATEGISVLAGSGDTGSEGCERQNHTAALATLDPASQPFVTAVGGTDLTGVGSPPAEKAWNDGTGAGGGGISSEWPMPPWQSAPGVPSAQSSGTPCGAATGDCREVPDVAASASGDNPYVVYYGNTWTAYAGTSASSPLWAALTADIESQGATFRAGFLNPSLYAFDVEGGAFNDITTGNIDWTGTHGGLYPTTAGYDMATGLGSPIASILASDFAANP
ncbi:MAG TPA: S53 family peptidase, partial [Acidimicrobiales bacterium]|nr:S53 family peptidase [Acidimicrobiales bacterium]